MRFTCFVFLCVTLLFTALPAEPKKAGTVSIENEQEQEAKFEIPRDQDQAYDDAVIYEVPRAQIEDEPIEEYEEKEDDDSSEQDHYTFVALIDIMFTDGCKRTCTGAIIHDNVVITAAHCFTMFQRKFLLPELSLSFVVIGTRRMFETGYEQYLPIEKVITHPKFREWTADLALVFTFANMYSDKPAEILPLALEKSSVPVDSNVTVLSWGKCTNDIEDDDINPTLESDKEYQAQQTERPDNTDDIIETPKRTRFNLKNKDRKQRIYNRDGNNQVLSEDNDEVQDLKKSIKTLKQSLKDALTSKTQEHRAKASLETSDEHKVLFEDDINNTPRFKPHDDNDEESQARRLKNTKTQKEPISPVLTPEQQQNYKPMNILQYKNMKNQPTNKDKLTNVSSLSEETPQPNKYGFEENYEKPERIKWINTTPYPKLRIKKVIRKPLTKVEKSLEDAHTPGARRGNNKQPSIQPFFDLQDYDGVSFVNPQRNETNETEFLIEKIKKPVENRRKIIKGESKYFQQRKIAPVFHKNRRSTAVGKQYINSGTGKYVRINKKKVRRYIPSSSRADLKKYQNWRRDIGEQHNNLTVGKFTYVNVATCKKMVERTLPVAYQLKNKHEYLCYSSEELYITNEDSGSPVVQKGELEAVTIGGIDSEGDHVAVGIKVACFCEWIASNLPNNDGSMLKCCNNCCNKKSHNGSTHNKEEPVPELRASLKKKNRQGKPGENGRFQNYYKF